MSVEVYRGDSATTPTLGKFSYWSTAESHAMNFAGFHLAAGDEVALYKVEITTARVLDLRTEDPWPALYDETGLDLRSAVGQRHNLIHARLPDFASRGFEWLARFADYATNDAPHRRGGVEEWIRLADGDVVAVRVRTMPNEWR